MADEFDMSFFMDKKLDHGLFSPLSALLPPMKRRGADGVIRYRSACCNFRYQARVVTNSGSAAPGD